MKKLLLLLLCCSFFGLTASAQTTILDFESDNTSTVFQYFGNFEPGIFTNVIPNPDMSGINTSATVSDFVKIANSEPWAGAYADPVTMPINVAAGNEVCIKVWSPKTGNLALKLEGGTLANWITSQDITETNTWVNICFNTSDVSIEDPFEAAAGGVYDQMVLFFDFNEVLTEETTFYFDDVIVGEGNLEPADVTFSVDMNNYSGSFDNVYLSGTFNNWSENANPMTDDDGDGVYTTTLTNLESGIYEYKFQVNEWFDQEYFSSAYGCTVTDPSGEFTNRSIFVVSDVVLNTVCWNSCFACGEAFLLTINLGAQAVDVSEEGLYIAGGGNWGVPGDNRLQDDDGDQIYSASYELPVGFESFYTFTNGACGDFSCKEDIAGQACSDPDNFDDRFMGPFTEDTTINTCFGVCTDNTDCESGGATQVTFSVDMNDYAGDYTAVFVSGSFANWSGNANPMSDADGDGIFTTTVDILPSLIEYKFQLDEWAVSEEFVDGTPCTITDPTGTFVNRFLEVSGSTQEVCFVWNTCDACEAPPAAIVTFEVDMNAYTESFETVYISGNFNDWSGNSNPMSDDDGDGIWTADITLEIGTYEYKFQLDEWVVAEQFVEGDPCTITDDTGEFTNRLLEVTGDMTAGFQWNSCDAIMVGVSDLDATDDLFSVMPTIVSTNARIIFNESYTSAKEVILFNGIGQIAQVINLRPGTQEYNLDVTNLQNGIYYINIQTEGIQQTQRFVVNK